VVLGLKALRFRYGASGREIEVFAESFVSVRRFARKYSDEGTRRAYLRAVCMFFKWLRLVHKLDLTPDEFVALQAKKRAEVDPNERLWGLDLALAFSRDNPDFAGNADSYKRDAYFLPLKLFCGANEVTLTSDKSVFGKCAPRKYEEKPYTVSLAKKVLAVLSQRNRAICMTMLQSGQSIKQVLQDVNGMADYVFAEMDAGKERIRLDFNGRKGNNFRYFSFISRDCIQEIAKWRLIREEWLRKAGKTSRWLFISKEGKRVTKALFMDCFKEVLRNRGIWTGPYTVRTHMFRKIFETEASPPDRGISKSYVGFMLGHSSGLAVPNKLDAVGGTYDQAPRIHANAVEREYAKLEPWINIYSSARTEQRVFSEEEVIKLRRILNEYEKATLERV